MKCYWRVSFAVVTSIALHLIILLLLSNRGFFEINIANERANKQQSGLIIVTLKQGVQQDGRSNGNEDLNKSQISAIDNKSNYESKKEHENTARLATKLNEFKSPESSTKIDLLTEKFYDREYLNRQPAILKSPVFDTVTLNKPDIGWGYADLWLYISENGSIVAVRVRNSNMHPDALSVAIAGIQSVQFGPGYINGQPVKSRIIWRVEIEGYVDVDIDRIMK